MIAKRDDCPIVVERRVNLQMPASHLILVITVFADGLAPNNGMSTATTMPTTKIYVLLFIWINCNHNMDK